MAESKLIKFDQGKSRWDLLMGGCAHALRHVANVITFGATKYSPGGWKEDCSAETIERYRAALYRHMNAIERGEYSDPESGFPHMAHVACNALFILELEQMYDEHLIETFHNIQEEAMAVNAAIKDAPVKEPIFDPLP